MVIKHWGEWLVAKQFHAGIVAFICVMLEMIGLPTGIIASVIVAFVALRNGSKFGAGVLLWVALPAIAMLIKAHFNPFDIVLIRCIVIYGLALILRHTHRWNDVLVVFTVLGLAAVAIAHICVPDLQQTWLAMGNKFIQTLTPTGQTPPQEWLEMVTAFSKVATGMMAFVVMLLLFVELLLARLWQSMVYNPGALRAELMQVRINRWLSLVLPLAIVLTWTALGHVIVDMLPVILFAFMIAGFVCLHDWVNGSPKLSFLVPVAYIATCIFGYLICVWALIGFIDAWRTNSTRAYTKQLHEKGDK